MRRGQKRFHQRARTCWVRYRGRAGPGSTKRDDQLLRANRSCNMTQIKSVDRAEALVKEAFREFVQCYNPQDLLSSRAQSAIRRFVGMFLEQAVAYGLPDDLRITLYLISQGLEQKISDDLRELFVEAEDGPDFEPWFLPDFLVAKLNLNDEEFRNVSDFDHALEMYVDDPKNDYAPLELFESAGRVRGLTLALDPQDVLVISSLTGTPSTELLDYDDAGRAVHHWFCQTWESGSRH